MVCFSPWAFAVTRAAIRRGGLESNIGSFARPTVEDLGEPLRHLQWAARSGMGKVVGANSYSCSPILLWAWHVYRRGNDSDPSITFWWLLLFSVFPVACAFIISQVAPQSIWGTRFFVNAAVPYLILVAVAIYRLRPGWLRSATLVLVVAWAGLSSLQGLNNTDKRAWEPLVYSMIGAELRRPAASWSTRLEPAMRRSPSICRRRTKDGFRPSGSSHWESFQGITSGLRPPRRKRRRNSSWAIEAIASDEGYADGFGAVLSPVWRQ